MDSNKLETKLFEKLKLIQDNGLDPYFNEFKPSIEISELIKKFDNYDKDNLSTEKFSIVGRMLINRGKGKTAFIKIKNKTNWMQVYLRKDSLDEKDWFYFENSSLGDLVGVEGTQMITHTGEATLRANKFTIIAKTLRPFPEKFHGLVDTEERYRKRYLDLILNDKTYQTFIDRQIIIKTIRKFLDERGFFEVETPILNSLNTGAEAKPFVTHHNALNIDLSLRIATELPLKRLIIGGMDKVFEIGRLFRNEGISYKHNPEFTSIEIYEAYGDINSMMNITEQIVKISNKTLGKEETIIYNDKNIDLKSKFAKRKMIDVVKEYTKLDFNEITFEEAKEYMIQNKLEVKEFFENKWYLMNEIFEAKCEEYLIQPTFIYEYPTVVSPLSREKKNDRNFVDRFELFINGNEYANGYSELNNPTIQKDRFLKQKMSKLKGNEEVADVDNSYIEAMEYGMPPTGGLGIGIDRLVMLLTNQKSIKEVIMFPQLKPEKND